MLWFNNHSWEQEHFYFEARETMRRQREAMKTDEERNFELKMWLFGIPIFIIVYNISHDFWLSLGSGFFGAAFIALLGPTILRMIGRRLSKSVDKSTQNSKDVLEIDPKIEGYDQSIQEKSKSSKNRSDRPEIVVRDTRSLRKVAQKSKREEYTDDTI